ncbi:hypothetical protein [Solirubrobacter soli]|nr:hypothetical protein [Solirubrobacter soli]
MPRKPQLPPKKRVVLPPKKAARPTPKPQPRVLHKQHRGGR